MVVYTDSISYAEQVVPPATKPWSPPADRGTDVHRLSETLYQGNSFHQSSLESDLLWKYLFIVEFASRSQYDVLIELARDGGALPDGVLCLAGDGDNFHGLKNRPWSASPGNIHLSVHLAPARPIEQSAVGFSVLAAVSVVETIDSIAGLNGRAGIKWVNDILIDDSKVCGVLAHTQTMKDTVGAAILGIGLNVETTPSVEPTPFSRRVAALRDFASDPSAGSQGIIFEKLIRALDRNYRSLLNGGYSVLLDRYRERSLVLGRQVAICSDEPGSASEVIATGRVSGLGDNLELFLDGVDKPVRRGRLILEDEKGNGWFKMNSDCDKRRVDRER